MSLAEENKRLFYKVWKEDRSKEEEEKYLKKPFFFLKTKIIFIVSACILRKSRRLLSINIFGRGREIIIFFIIIL